MRGINSETIDLIYPDPPFNSKINYSAPIGSEAAGVAFKDTGSLNDLDLEWIREMQFHEPALERVINAAMMDSDKFQQIQKHRADELLDEPCANPRYGGFTLREAVRKVVLRRGDLPPDRSMHELGDTDMRTQS